MWVREYQWHQQGTSHTALPFARRSRRACRGSAGWAGASCGDAGMRILLECGAHRGHYVHLAHALAVRSQQVDVERLASHKSIGGVVQQGDAAGVAQQGSHPEEQACGVASAVGGASVRHGGRRGVRPSSGRAARKHAPLRPCRFTPLRPAPPRPSPPTFHGVRRTVLQPKVGEDVLLHLLHGGGCVEGSR